MRVLVLIYLGFFSGVLSAQENSLKSIKGLPTEEVFDLLSDHRGFLWAAHTLGISRYDGTGFAHFSNPLQTGLSASGLCEDQQGRIWCFNFNGQLFYIENEKMNLFVDYNTKEDLFFPSMVIQDSELVVTAEKGIYVINTRTLKGKFLPTPDGALIARSICAFRDKVITGLGDFYAYHSGKGYYKIPLVITDPKESAIFKKLEFIPIHTTDTIYAINKSIQTLYKLIERKDTLILVSSQKISSMINTVTTSKDGVWVNTKKFSFNARTGQRIENHNITDIVDDIFGNRWYGSLQEGIKTESRVEGWVEKKMKFLPAGDFIRSISSFHDTTLYGTQSGKILVEKDNQLITTIQLPLHAGAVEKIFPLPFNRMLIAPSQGLYIANIEKGSIAMLSNSSTVKSVAITDTTMLLGYSQSLAKFSLKHITEMYKNGIDNKANEDLFDKAFYNCIRNCISYIRNINCFQVNYNEKSKNTYAIFKNELARIVNDSVIPIQFENKRILAKVMVQRDNQLFIGTVNNGFLIYTDGLFQHIGADQGLMSNTILKMKLFDDELILIEPGYLQIWNVRLKKFTTTAPLPNESQGSVHDFMLENGIVHLHFSNSLYQLKLSEVDSMIPLAYLLSVVKGEDKTTIPNNAVLEHDQNSVQFLMASPSYIHPDATYFMYRLAGSNDSSWKRLNPPIFNISYQSLGPGNYHFIAYAVNFKGERSENTLDFKFTIKLPWWQEWWFLSLLFVIMGIISFIVFYTVLKNIRRQSAVSIEKISLQNELRKSLLRTIVTQMNPHFIFNALNTIQSFVYQNDKRSVSNYMGKFSELIRKILHTSNYDAISLKEEIEILELYVDLERARFENRIHVNIDIDPSLDIENMEIPPMFIQPCIENAIKHGLFHKKEEGHLNIKIALDPDDIDLLKVIIDDDGVGRSRSMEINDKMNQNRSHISFAGLALEKRVELINHTLVKKISVQVVDKPDNGGTTVYLKLPINKKNI